MAPEIVPIELGLTNGNVVTLWAPRWREDGEDWEAFLGHGDDLYVFPDATRLAAFVRSSTEHDLLDHPEWATAAALLIDELTPDDDHRFDVVGVPDLVAEVPDIWTLAELADTVAIVRSLAEVCGLDKVEEILDSADGFSVLALGEQAFSGRQGEKLWDEIGAVVSERWDEVVDALDSVVTTPDIDDAALAAAQEEAAAIAAAARAIAPDDEVDEDRDEDLEFWDEIGIDCLEVTVDGRTGWTLRCYLDETPVFLADHDRILVWSSPGDLENFITMEAQDHDLASLEVWADVRRAVADGDAAVLAGPENTYLLDGYEAALREGPEAFVPRARQAGPLDEELTAEATDPAQLALAVELLTDAAVARGDEETVEALSTATPLGQLLNAASRPDPDRQPPSPPFDDEIATWTVLRERFAATLEWDRGVVDAGDEESGDDEAV